MNSIDFIKGRIKSGDLEGYSEEGWDKSNRGNPLVILQQMWKDKNNDISKYIHDNIFEYIQKVAVLKKYHQRKITIEYNPDYNYDYCIIRESTHDGTCLFTYDLIGKTLEPLLNGESCNKNTLPKDIIINDVESIFKYDIKYIIGDLLLNSSFGTKNINRHNWSGETDIVAIPVKTIFIKEE